MKIVVPGLGFNLRVITLKEEISHMLQHSLGLHLIIRVHDLYFHSSLVKDLEHHPKVNIIVDELEHPAPFFVDPRV